MNFSKRSNRKKQKERKSSAKKNKNRIGVIIFRVICIAILILIFAGAGSSIGAIMGIIHNAPPIDKNNLIPKGYTTVIYDTNGKEITQLDSEINRISVKLDQIPENLQHAVIAIEDERFYDHFGIDVKGILRAFFVNIKNMNFSEGASTLTQQLIKNNVLTHEKKLQRKIKEQYLAVQIEKQLTQEYNKKRAKELILESYLNTINLAHGNYGVQAASQMYFNKDVSDLTLAECAAIASTIKSPMHYSPKINPENNKERSKIVLDKMLEQKYITKEEHDAALKEDIYTNVKENNQNMQSQSTNSYFVDAVIDEVAKDLSEKSGYTERQALDLIYRGGLNIYITQDQEIQKVADDAFNNDDLFPPKNQDFKLKLLYTVSALQKDGKKPNHYIEKLVNSKEEAAQFIEEYKASVLQPDDEVLGEKVQYIPQPQAAMVIMDYKNGQVKAIVGGRGEKYGNRTFNRAIDALRHPGSVFKVVASYAPALDTAGYTPATIIDDVPLSINIPGQAPYRPNNWYSGYRGLSTAREGIKDSMNILAVKVLHDIGIPTSWDYLKNFGFTTLVDSKTVNGETYSDKNYSLALGGLSEGVNVLETTAAFGSIANKGVYNKPILYTKVIDHDGNLLLENKPETHTVLKETTAFLLTDMMRDVVQRGGTGRLANFNPNMPIAGKTGTSSDNKDLTFAGYTPYYASAIWMGHDNSTPLNTYRSYHLDIWKAVMGKIHENLPVKQFERPDGIVSRQICIESGKLAVKGLCDHDPRGSRVRTEYFVKGTEPTETCDTHVKVNICKESGLFANRYCPEDQVEEKIYIKRPEDKQLPYDSLSESVLNSIQDFKYELPPSMEGEYCNIHGPESAKPDNPFDPDYVFPNDPLPPPVEDERDSLDDFFNFGN